MKPDLSTVYDRATLVAAVAAGAKPKYLAFWGHTGAADEVGPFVFSQWRHAPFVIDGIRYPTAEHYMMAQKAILFGDEIKRSEIIVAPSPAAAKALGRMVAHFDESTWAAQRFEIVVAASVAKFGQNRSLSGYLATTGTKVLVEAAPRDRIWGVGMGRDNPAIGDPARWRGLNLLGFALMKARTMLGEQ
jgi:ribA/ribD-fused uncharacterized protein